MRLLYLQLATLLLALPVWAGEVFQFPGSTAEAVTSSGVCTPTCDPQAFDVDPFPTQWTAFDSNGTCPVTWDSGSEEVRRTLTGASCATDGWAKFKGDISENGCARYRVKLDNAGSSPRFGFIARSADTSLNSGHITMACDWVDATNSTCHLVSVPSSWQLASDCTTFGTISLAADTWNWVGMCINGEGPTTTIKAFNLGTDTTPFVPPADPATTDGGGVAWGVAECTFGPLNCVSGTNFLCDDTGNFWGVYLGNVADPNDYISVDDLQTYSCM